MSKYGYTGHVIRLTKKDYRSWLQNLWPAHMQESDFIRYLNKMDDYFVKNPNKKWFMAVSSALYKNLEKQKI